LGLIDPDNIGLDRDSLQAAPLLLRFHRFLYISKNKRPTLPALPQTTADFSRLSAAKAEAPHNAILPLLYGNANEEFK